MGSGFRGVGWGTAPGALRFGGIEPKTRRALKWTGLGWPQGREGRLPLARGGGHAPRWGAPMAADPSAVKAFPAAGEWRTPLPHKQEGDHRPNPRGGVRRRGGDGRVPSDHDLSYQQTEGKQTAGWTGEGGALFPHPSGCHKPTAVDWEE